MSTLHVEIILQEDLNETWKVWFEGLSLQKAENNATCLSGDIPDQAALFGWLERLRDLNLHLVSVQVKSFLQEGNP